jgi:hypothetical protein
MIRIRVEPAHHRQPLHHREEEASEGHAVVPGREPAPPPGFLECACQLVLESRPQRARHRPRRPTSPGPQHRMHERALDPSLRGGHRGPGAEEVPDRGEWIPAAG